jgi:hypothetical protein
MFKDNYFVAYKIASTKGIVRSIATVHPDTNRKNKDLSAQIYVAKHRKRYLHARIILRGI